MTSGQYRKEIKEGYGEEFIIRNMLKNAIHRIGAARRRIASSIPFKHGV